MNQDNCSGVFAPVCSPEICDVPRVPYEQDLVMGYGYVRNLMACDSDSYVKFYIHIYRELFDVFGTLNVIDSKGRKSIHTSKLESYHAPTEEKMIAVFHFDDQSVGNSKELAVYASVESEKKPAKFYIYTAPLMDDEIYLGGNVKKGTIKIENSLVEHEH